MDVLILYGGLAVAYLMVFSLATYFYLNKRWYVASSLERAFMYFLVFFFFPGLLLWGPLLNFRNQPRSLP
ncbi:NAD(P)H-quinone oxidoreductase subunit L [Gloeomargaritales cyanobacterium VI4D9]|nr:NAD(P)H-quinone oxidoreductase subunit L [Gloeomargaritales cyanobacterium VI4D9]